MRVRNLGTFFGGMFRRRRTPYVFELTPLEQVVMRFILRSEPATYQDIAAETGAQRPLDAADTPHAVANLQGRGLVRKDVNGTERFRATPLGRRLDGKLPIEPKSVIEFRL